MIIIVVQILLCSVPRDAAATRAVRRRDAKCKSGFDGQQCALRPARRNTLPASLLPLDPSWRWRRFTFRADP